MGSHINTLLKSNIQIPAYAVLLNVNVTLLLLIVTKSLSNISCDVYLDFDGLFN